jgi:hypothetical protein
MATDRCLELDAAFCRRFLPAPAANGHSLLLDWDGHVPFTPDAEGLHRCLAEYTALVEEAVRDDPCDVVSLHESSELTLAHLYRGLGAGVALPEGAVVPRLGQLLERVLRAAAESFGPRRWEEEMKWYDGFKCPDAIASLLETVRAEAAFRQRFLPAGAASPHALLVDFSRQLAFTPSAAELQQCLEAYAALLGRATRVTCMPARWCAGASELALAHVSRAVEAGTPLPDAATVNRLTRLLRRTLADALTLFGAMRWYDGFKRIDLLAWLLEEHAPRGLPGWHVFRARLRQVLRID